MAFEFQPGKHDFTTTRATLVINTSTPVLKPNPRRRAIIFSTNSAGLTFDTAPITAVFTGAIIMQQSGSPRVLTYEDVGDMLCAAWYAFSSVADAVVVTEVFDLHGEPQGA